MTTRLSGLALSLLLLPALLLPAAARAQEFDYERFTLPNGMTVILHEDHSLPIAVVNLWYGVGSKDERPGRSGFAHLFEHLMFMGTERVPGGQFDEIMASGGGFNNATTSFDRTNYFSSGPSNLLPTLLWLEADRMQAVGRTMTQEKLDKQREVVRNERRQSYENRPYGKADLLVTEVMFPEGHPYHISVIGKHEELEAASVGDVTSFFDAFYVPSNVSLVVAGDFDPKVIRPEIERLFGALPARPVPAHAKADPVQLDGPKRLQLTDQVQLPRVSMAWHSPALFAAGDAEMDVIAMILGGGLSSRLHDRLVRREQVCSDVFVYQESRTLGSLFNVGATCDPDVPLSRVEAILDEEIAALRDQGPKPQELERVRNWLERALLERAEKILDRADMLNAYQHHRGEPDSLAWDLQRYRAVTAAGVKEWSRKVLDPEKRLIVHVTPEPEAGQDPLAQRPSGGQPSAFAFPQPETFRLANGLTVHHWHRDEMPLMAARLVVPGGAALDGPERAGLAHATADMLDEGTARRTAAEFAAALEVLGAQLAASADRAHSTVTLSALSRNFPDALGLMTEAVSQPAFTEADWQRVRNQRVQELRRAEDEPTAVALEVASVQLFGADHPYGRPAGGTVDSVSGLELADLKSLHAATFRPDRSILLTAGSVPRAELEPLLGRTLGGWTAGSGPPAEMPEIVALEPGDFRTVLVNRDDAVQTVVRFTWPGPDARTTERMPLEMLNTLFGGSFTSRLNLNLRERNGYTYGAGSRFVTLPDAGYAIAVSQVRADVTGASLKEFLAEFDAVRAGGIGAEERDRAAATVRNRLVDDTAGLSGILGQAEEMLVAGLPFSTYDEWLAGIERVKASDLDALAKSRIAPKQGVLVLVGDRDTVLAQLDGLGLPAPVEVDIHGRPVAAGSRSASAAGASASPAGQ